MVLSTRKVANNRGATLVEVMAAVTLLGLVGVGVYALAMLPVRALETAQPTILYERSIRAMVQTLTRDLANVTPDGYITRPHFVGARDGMEFTVGPGDDPRERRVIAYVFRPWWMVEPLDGNQSDSHPTGQLLRREGALEGERIGDRVDFEGEKEILRAGAVQLEYYDADAHLWLSSWDGSLRGWPSAVRLIVTAQGELPEDRVEFLFPLYIGRTFEGAGSS